MDIVGCNIDKGSDSSMVNEMGMGYVLIHVVVVLDTSEVDFWLLVLFYTLGLLHTLGPLVVPFRMGTAFHLEGVAHFPFQWVSYTLEGEGAVEAVLQK